MTPLQGEAFQRFMGLSYFSSLMAAWAAIIHGGGKLPRHHDFCALPAFSADLTVKGLIGITVEAEIPVEAVPGHHNFGDEGFDYTVWHVDPFHAMGILFQRVLEDGILTVDIYDFLLDRKCLEK